jgi:hypothetical protein
LNESSGVPCAPGNAGPSSEACNLQPAMSATAPPQRAKLRAVLLNLLCRTRAKASFGVEDAQNVLHDVDREYHCRYSRHLIRESPSGQCRGPMDEEFRNAVAEMGRDGLTRNVYDQAGFHRLVPLVEPDPAALTEEEQGIIDSVLSAYLERQAAQRDEQPEPAQPIVIDDEDNGEEPHHPRSAKGQGWFGTALFGEFFRWSTSSRDGRPPASRPFNSPTFAPRPAP